MLRTEPPPTSCFCNTPYITVQSTLHFTFLWRKSVSFGMWVPERQRMCHTLLKSFSQLLSSVYLNCQQRTSPERGHHFVALQLLSRVQLFVTPWTAICQASLSFSISWSLLKLMSIESVMPSNHLNLCHPLLLLPSVFPSIRVFSNESALYIRWPKYWSFSFSISVPMNILGWFPLGWTGWISLQSKGLSRVFSSTTVQSIHSLALSFLYCTTFISIHDYWKTIAWLDGSLLTK